MKIHLDNTHSVGLGDNLCLISVLANTKEKVELHVDNRHDTYDRLCQMKRIFMIPDSNIEIFESNSNGNFRNTGWPLKLHSDYYRPKQVNVNGQILDTATKHPREKRCIAMAAFYDTKPENNNNEWPWCKHRDLDYWSKIFAYIKDLHYDVITVDRHMFDLEHKIEAMVKNCKAINSYEGGMAHLAHMLNIPLLLVDWTYPAPSTNLDRFHCEFVHRSKTMYLLRDDNELLSWSGDEFEKVIHDLRFGMTNNRLVNGDCKLTFTGPGVYGDIRVFNKNNDVVLHTSGLYDANDEASRFLNDQAVFPK